MAQVVRASQRAGIEVVIHDVPEGVSTEGLIAAMRFLQPVAIWVDCGGIGRSHLIALQRAGLHARPLSKVPRDPDCPAHDSRCTPDFCAVALYGRRFKQSVDETGQITRIYAPEGLLAKSWDLDTQGRYVEVHLDALGQSLWLEFSELPRGADGAHQYTWVFCDRPFK